MGKPVISGAVGLLVVLVILFLIPNDLMPTLPLNQDMAVAAGKVLAGLLVVALMLERALAVFNDLLFATDRTRAQSEIALARLVSTAALKTAAEESLSAGNASWAGPCQ